MNKAAGLLCQPGRDRGEDDLFSLVRAFLGQRDGCARPYLGQPHRIDRGTSGVVLFTKTRHINPAIAAIFATGRAQKRYHALCAKSSGPPCPLPPAPQEWTVDNLLEAEVSRGRRRQREVGEGGKIARTDFRILQEFPDAFLIEARPVTGRFHQVRAHLAGVGQPILGDRLYGYPGRVRRWAPRPMLHATSLSFDHPREDRRVEIQSPLPEDFRIILTRLSG